jgi:hypothetical protein
MEGDSLFAVFSSGFSGLGFRFRVAGDSLTGVGEVLSDMAGIDFPRAPANGWRTKCSIETAVLPAGFRRAAA